MAEKPDSVDIVILTVLSQEYLAMRRCLKNSRSALFIPANQNHYDWELGEIQLRDTDETYKVALGTLGQAGNGNSALATQDALSMWIPAYLFFVGIAGGFPVNDIKNGDVVVSDVIYGYEYGKIDEDFHIRHNLTFRADQPLLVRVMNFASRNKKDWLKGLGGESEEFCPQIVRGNIASGDKVVDNPNHPLFARVIQTFWPIHAVEMEAAGVAAAIDKIKDRKYVRFLVIRGISDMPRVSGEGDLRGTKERDLWKERAAMAAAVFTAAFIADGLLDPPKHRALADQEIQRSEDELPSVQKSGDNLPSAQKLEASLPNVQMLGEKNVYVDRNSTYNDNSRSGTGPVAITLLIVVVLVVSLVLYWIVSRSTITQIVANTPMILPTAAPAFPPTATPDMTLQSALRWNVVFSDTFTGVSSSLPVTRTTDKYADVQTSVVQDTYQIKMNAPNEAVGWSLPHYATGLTNFLDCIDILKVSAVPNSAAAFMFHVKEYEDENDSANAYFYGITIIPDTKMYRVKGNVNNDMNIDGEFKDTFSLTSDAIHASGVNRICVLAKGSHFWYYINGANVYDNSGYIYNSGKINVAVYIPKGGGEATYQFDNLEIRAP